MVALGSMCKVAKQCAQTVMRADGLLPRLANVEGWRTSLAEVPGKSGKSDTNNTHEQLKCAVNHEALVSWRSKSFRRGNHDQWQLQQTHRNMFNRRAAREHFPYLCTSPEEHMQVSGAAIKINGSFSRHIESCSTCHAK